MLTSLKTKSPVLGMAVHPSGRIAIGTYKDRHLRMWDLLKGRIAWKKTLKTVGELVAFDPCGTGEFVVGEGSKVCSYSDGEIQQSMEHDGNVLCFGFVRPSLLVCGTNDGHIHVWRTDKGCHLSCPCLRSPT